MRRVSAAEPIGGIDPVDEIRQFNRFYTNVVGALRGDLLGIGYSLAEARVIFELAQAEATAVSDLRNALDVDAGYLSRTLSRFEAGNLLVRERSMEDRRRQVVRLTKKGSEIFRRLDKRAGAEVRELLSRLNDADLHRLLGSMRAIREILEERPRPDHYVLRQPMAGDYGWVIQRHGALYARKYGWDETFEALVARIVAGYVESHDPARESAWIAEVDGEPVGCVFCVAKDNTTAQLRLLLVEPSARGMGIGMRLVDECLRFAQRIGYQQMILWTNDVLVDARRVYERARFQLVEEEPHHSFGHDLVGQIWRRDLATTQNRTFLA